MFDFLRHKYCANDAENYIISTYGNAVQECESGVIARDLESAEKRRVDRMPTQRRMVYMLKRYDDKKVAEIARGQNLSVRTVENHLRMARADIRQYMTKLMCVWQPARPTMNRTHEPQTILKSNNIFLNNQLILST